MHIVTNRFVCLLMVVLLATAAGCGAKQPTLPGAALSEAPAQVETEGQEGLNAGDAVADEAIALEGGDEFGDEGAVYVADPLEPWNRFWFGFNDIFFQGVIQPLGTGYNYVMPEEARTGIKNFFHNLMFPVRFVNCILQGKFKGAGVQMARFVGNTAFGFGGLSDHFNRKKSIVESYDEDFGQTLAVWGVPDGFYLVLPLLGPSTLRDSAGSMVDRFGDPITYLNPWPFYFYEPAPYWIGATARGTSTFNALSFRLDEYDRFKDAAVEPYTAMRDGYIQNRLKEIDR